MVEFATFFLNLFDYFGPQGPAAFQAEGLRARPKGPTASGSASAPDVDLHGFTRFYAVFTRIYAVLRGFTRFYADLRGFTKTLHGFTWIYADLRGFYVDLRGLTQSQRE